ncbi:hypothetical protein BGZ70_006483 [Mortierella alpina]|uniref:FAM192A/Fyv6 N-terminal domain-containing protein n=1 Tax=Mortierella alpina TaxID=64518 RepID=A0A9P6J7X3_MORAP|nr:hypothetical protein BGZ70_006483 [Mortierella alpina]
MSSINFVSAGKASMLLYHSIEEARKERQEEWKKAYENKENPPPIQEEVPYDPRTLYERLQEQKQKKDDAFAEATKFGNLIHRIDNDEFDFLSTLENEEAQKKRELAEQEEEELKKFRMNVQLKTAPVPSSSLVNSNSTVLGAASGSIVPGPFTATAAPKKKSSLFAGLVKRDNNPSSSKSSASHSAIENVSARTASSATTDASSQSAGKRKADEAPDTIDPAIEGKKPRLTPLVAPSTPKKPSALQSLVAYDSSSDEDDE